MLLGLAEDLGEAFARTRRGRGRGRGRGEGRGEGRGRGRGRAQCAKAPYRGIVSPAEVRDSISSFFRDSISY